MKWPKHGDGQRETTEFVVLSHFLFTFSHLFSSFPPLLSTSLSMEAKTRIPLLLHMKRNTTTTFKHKKEPVDSEHEHEHEDDVYDSGREKEDEKMNKKKKKKKKKQQLIVLASSFSHRGGSGRKGSGAGGVSAPPPCCQAENCSVDLTEVKMYHRRHKVCEHHSKASEVMVAGLCQRFCQQCSRFHELSEFDDTKRSCRRRLAGHNERRRKSSSASHGKSSSRKGVGTQLKETHCRQADQSGRLPVNLPKNVTFKHFQIR